MSFFALSNSHYITIHFVHVTSTTIQHLRVLVEDTLNVCNAQVFAYDHSSLFAQHEGSGIGVLVSKLVRSDTGII